MYSDIKNGVIIHLMDIGAGWLITSIGVQSHQRGTGAASRLFDELLKDSEKERVTMFLSIEPDGTGLSEDELRAWYLRKGFRIIPDSEDTAMERIPANNNDR